MAYDEDLADRIRELLAAERGVTEQRLFGGLSFLLGGNLAVAASREGGILVRVGSEDAARLVATTKAEVAVMGARTMRGWLRLAGADVRTRRQLGPWVERGAAHARSLPPKA
jgi:TfoX/Sxy family transcriptional regulator of competence genes